MNPEPEAMPGGQAAALRSFFDQDKDQLARQAPFLSPIPEHCEAEAKIQARLAACMEGTPAQKQRKPPIVPARQADSLATCPLTAARRPAEQSSAMAADESPAAAESDAMGFSPGTSDKHGTDAVPQTKSGPTVKKQKRRDAWCAEQAQQLIGFGLQYTPAPEAQRKGSSKKRPTIVESLKAQLESRKARKTAAADAGPGSAERQTSAAGGKASGSDSEASGARAVMPEDSGEAWAGLRAEEQGPQPSKTQTLQGNESDEDMDLDIEATTESRPAQPQNFAPGAPTPRTISPSFTVRRSAREAGIPAEALESPHKGAAAQETASGRQQAQQTDGACTISFLGAGGESQAAGPAAKGAARPPPAQTAAQKAMKAKQMAHAAAEVKARKAQGEALRPVHIHDIDTSLL